MDLSKFKIGNMLQRKVDALTSLPKPEIRLHTEMLQQLASRLHVENPQYEFTIDCERHGGDVHKDTNGGLLYIVANKIEVRHLGLLIGTVRGGYFRGRYALELRAISPTGNIQEQTTTTDVQRASSFVKRRLCPANEVAILASKAKDVQSMLSKANSKYSRALYSAQIDASDLMVEYAIKNIAAFAAAYPNNAKVSALAKVVKDNAENSHVTNMYDAFEKGKLRTATEANGGSWLLGLGSMGAHTVGSWEELPDEIRAKLGLLRMTEDGTIIEGVGARVNSTTFALCPEDSHGA